MDSPPDNDDAFDADAAGLNGRPPLPACCDPEAFRLMRRQVGRIESSGALLNAAAAISLHSTGHGDPDQLDARLQSLADDVRARCRSRDAQARLAHLHALLFDDLGFRGGGTDTDRKGKAKGLPYGHPSHSFLPAVLDSRRGLPIALSLVYRLVAERVGLRAWGVGLPGHFVAGVEVDGQSLTVDPFHGGRLLDGDDVRGVVARATGHDAADLDGPMLDALLRPTPHVHWVTRMIQNLLPPFNAAGRFRDVAAMLELQMLLWPGQTQLRRDLGLVLARAGLPGEAVAWLDSYLEEEPGDPQADDLADLVRVLRA